MEQIEGDKMDNDNDMMSNVITENPLEEKKKVEYERNCPHCKKDFKTISKKKVFCSKSCCDRYYAIRKYYSLRDNPEYKSQRKEKNRLYYQAHREEFLAKMKIYGKEYYQKRREMIKQFKQIQEANNGLNSEQTRN